MQGVYYPHQVLVAQAVGASYVSRVHTVCNEQSKFTQFFTGGVHTGVN